MNDDKPVKQKQAADYLGIDKATVKSTFAEGVTRSGDGEGKVRVSDVLGTLRRMGQALRCPTCGAKGEEVPNA